MTTLDTTLAAVASAAGAAVASVTGFGLGSLLTPVLARTTAMDQAVALVAVPHAVATGWRLWVLRRAIDWSLLRWFGVASAAGGIAGTLVASRWASPSTLLLIFGLLLVSS
ncbi:MAG: sulfite exporter TauE/SafE family protein, partial [Gemmatimonadaceae bacterium]|nr:sulfite exporter TauE/SafE family protein [Gemmatimonadaceae bacterium]